MAPDEVRVFERNPASRGAIALRGWDDGGKVDGLEVATAGTPTRPAGQRVSFL